MHDLIPLALIPIGRHAHVEHVTGNPDHVRRLNEMGLSGGRRIEMLQPGSPCIIRLEGHKLCFRADEVTSVLVKLEESA